MAQPSAVSVTSLTRKQMASFSLSWHVLMNTACTIFHVVIHILGVTVAVYLAPKNFILLRYLENILAFPCCLASILWFSESGERQQVMCGEMAVSPCLKCCEVQTVSKLAVPCAAASTVAFSVANVDFPSPNPMIQMPP